MGASDKQPQTDEDDATPGDAAGVSVPHEQAVSGSSEEFPAVQGVRVHPADPEPEEANRGGKSF